MGSQCSALRRGKIEEDECDTPHKIRKKDEVSTTVSREKSPLLHRRRSLQEEGGAGKEEETLERQEEETSSEKLGCETSSAPAHEYTVVEVNPSK